MNKLIIMVAIFITVPIIAIELDGITQSMKGDETTPIKDLIISSDENEKFVFLLSLTVKFNQDAVKKRKIHPNNDIHQLLIEIAQDLEFCDNNLMKMLKMSKYQKVKDYIADYVKFNKIGAWFSKHQVFSKHRILSEEDNILRREALAEWKLQSLYRHYRPMILEYKKNRNFDQDFDDSLEQQRIKIINENGDFLFQVCNLSWGSRQQSCMERYLALLLYKVIFVYK